MNVKVSPREDMEMRPFEIVKVPQHMNVEVSLHGTLQEGAPVSNEGLRGSEAPGEFELGEFDREAPGKESLAESPQAAGASSPQLDRSRPPPFLCGRYLLRSGWSFLGAVAQALRCVKIVSCSLSGPAPG